MASTSSFDITCECDLQEVDNAVNQANKELSNRYDFRNVVFSIELRREDSKLVVTAPDSYKLQAIVDVLRIKLSKRGVANDNIEAKDEQSASGNSRRQEFHIKQAIDSETAKKIAKFVKDQGRKKVQASILKDQVRISAPSRDDLQDTIAALKAHAFGLALSFGNFRG